MGRRREASCFLSSLVCVQLQLSEALVVQAYIFGCWQCLCCLREEHCMLVMFCEGFLF